MKTSKKSESKNIPSSYLDSTNYRSNYEENTKSNESYKALSTRGDSKGERNKAELYNSYLEKEQEQEQVYCSKKTTENLSKQELNMFGLYKLNKRDEETYRKFVEILKKMDPFDAVSYIFIHFIFLLFIYLFFRKICSTMPMLTHNPSH